MNTITAALSEALKLTFEFQGAERTLNKHPRVQQAVRGGSLSEADALATPWYLRIRGASPFKLCVDNDAAIAAAKAHLKGKVNKPDEWKQFLTDRAAKNGVSVGTLAREWVALKCPDESGRPRTQEARNELEPLIVLALLWWDTKAAGAVTGGQMLQFATWKRQQCALKGRGTGDRAVDKQLGALSNMCAWAVAAEKLAKNPFAERQTFRDSKAIEHCHQFMPDSDEDWHRVLNWFFTTPYEQVSIKPAARTDYTLRRVIAGAWLAWCGLTGLRPEEPRHLFRYPAITELTVNPSKLPPGTIFTLRDGTKKMKVGRDKHGQNPYVVLHPAALDFLDHWQRWLALHLPPVKQNGFALAWFPDPTEPTRPIYERKNEFHPLNKGLRAACKVLALTTELKPKGFGRAYYVRVRRSMGVDDSTIANELGQTTDGELIRTTYGEPDDMNGGALFDWLPEVKKQPATPAWHALTAHAAQNIIAL